MLLKWISNCFNKRRKLKQTIKQNLNDKFNYFLNIFQEKKQFYWTKLEFNNMFNELNQFKDYYFKNKKLLTSIEQDKIEKLILEFNYFENHEAFNNQFINNLIANLPPNFFKFNNILLDQNQVTSILKADKINLVIAGAGSGKTTTILGKIKHLIAILQAKPTEILILSYSNKSVNDLNNKIDEYLKYPLKAQTIHAFAQSITTQVEKQKKYKAASNNLWTEVFATCLKENQQFTTWLTHFIAYYWVDDEEDIDIDDIIKHKIPQNLNANTKLITLKNETVKSKEELKIANFLFLNGINYKYEQKYKYDIRTINYSQYYPDFYLTDYDIYWEHFGISRNGNTIWTASNPNLHEKYIKSRDWKIKCHEENKTKLIETFSYELQNNDWQNILINKLNDNKIVIKPISFTKQEFQKMLNNNKQLTALSDLFNNLLNSYEEHELTPTLIKLKLNNLKGIYYTRTTLLLNMFFTLLKEYKLNLKNNDEITFNQMIKKGCENFANFNIPYKYVIIDEFQDISPLKIKLINALIACNSINQFYFVGDDWQSIYGFSGSKVELFTNFLHDNQTSITYITNTYRNSQELIEITSNFITKDQNMTKKVLKSTKNIDLPIKIYDYTTIKQQNNYQNITNQAEIIEKLIQLHFQNNPNYYFVILARHNISINQLLKSNLFLMQNQTEIILKKIPEAKINFITIHSSKGLEADFVFVLNVSADNYGLPSQITNDPIIFLFNESTRETFIKEERRVFYVALTRTKNIVYLLTAANNHSEYITELELYDNVETNYQPSKLLTDLLVKQCPICVLPLKENSLYVACLNQQFCNIKIKIADINEHNELCENCSWIMILRDGKFGKYYNCVYCRKILSFKKYQNENRNFSNQ